MRPSNHLYVATDDRCFKIGIACDPHQRVATLGRPARLIKAWCRPYARQLEALIKSVFEDRRTYSSEWFAVGEREMMFHVNRAIRIQDDDEAIQRGLEPSKRPGPGEPSYEPPFDLPWLEVPRKR